ncbi:MAG: hypothetical protein KAS94_04595 [Desulfobulbaceae bacterium]|nr:hypothetical protein [Desulfobulbaceae bacterium]
MSSKVAGLLFKVCAYRDRRKIPERISPTPQKEKGDSPLPDCPPSQG